MILFEIGKDYRDCFEGDRFYRIIKRTEKTVVYQMFTADGQELSAPTRTKTHIENNIEVIGDGVFSIRADCRK